MRITVINAFRDDETLRKEQYIFAPGGVHFARSVSLAEPSANVLPSRAVESRIFNLDDRPSHRPMERHLAGTRLLGRISILRRSG